MIKCSCRFRFQSETGGVQRAFSVSIETGCQFESQLKPKNSTLSGEDRFTLKRWLPVLNIIVGNLFTARTNGLNREFI